MLAGKTRRGFDSVEGARDASVLRGALDAFRSGVEPASSGRAARETIAIIEAG